MPRVAPVLDHTLHMIEDLRGQVRDLIADLPAEALNWLPLPEAEDHSMNSLAVMAAHVAGAEHFWIAEVIGGYPATRRPLSRLNFSDEYPGTPRNQSTA